MMRFIRIASDSRFATGRARSLNAPHGIAASGWLGELSLPNDCNRLLSDAIECIRSKNLGWSSALQRGITPLGLEGGSPCLPQTAGYAHVRRCVAGVVIGFALAFACRADALTPAQAEARSALLSGVRVVDADGVPGAVLCLGTNAFPVVGAKCGSGVQSMVAACTYGKGRVVAAGHPSFYSGGVAKADTATFIKNAVQWLGNGSTKVAVYRNDSAGKTLRGIGGLEVTTLPSLDALERGAVLLVIPDDVKADEVERLRTHVVDGGGLLVAGIGWGWQQVSRGKSLVTDNQFNRLLGPAGLLINDAYAERTAPDGYLADFALPDGINAADALRLAIAGGVTDRNVQRQISQTLGAVMKVLPPDDAKNRDHATAQISNGLRVLLTSPDASKLPSPKTPLKANDLAARLALVLHQNEWLAKPLAPQAAHPAAAVYPGLPPKDAPRGSSTLALDLRVPRWRGTGLYAAAGEPVTVELPPGAKDIGLKLRIGATTCDNTRHDEWRRAPRVDIEVPLDKDQVTVASPFGGLLYVVVPSKPKDPLPPEVKLTFRNVCRSVWFKKGRDSLATWRAKLRDTPSPWAELESDKIILTVPSDVVRELDDPQALLVLWDRIADQDARLTGLPPERQSPERFCADVQLCAGWMHAGYPIMVPVSTAKDLVDAAKLKETGDWGFFHELGHNHQNGDWTFRGTGEVTVNFFTLYNMEHICGIPPLKTRMGEEGQKKKVQKWVAAGKSHETWCNDPFLALEVFVRIQQVYGWGAFEKLFGEYRTLGDEQRPKNDDAKRDQWAVRLSRVTGHNMAAVFDAWSIPLTDAARSACAAYPEPKDARLFEDVL